MSDAWLTPLDQPQPSGSQDEWLNPISNSGSSPDPWLTPLDNSEGQILKQPTEVTQNFGTVNAIEPTAGHRAGDTNFAANSGDAISAPPGEWEVVKAYTKASSQGAPGNYQDNSGWGNDVWLKDTKTGQMVHFLHMADVNAAPGQTVKGGQVVGSVGSSGNATGPNLGVEYYNQNGELNDFMTSPYAKSIPINNTNKSSQ